LNPRRLIGFLFSLLISAIFLALALAPVDFSKLARAFALADYRLVLLASGFTISAYVLRAARWRQLLAPSQKIPLHRLFPVLIVGFALNNLLPGRPGEFARAYSLGKREQISKMLTLGTVVVERVADGVALIAFLLFAFVAFSPLHLDLPAVAEIIGVVATIVFGVALGGLLFLLRRETLALALIRQFERWMPKNLVARFERMLQSFVLGLHALKSSRAAFDIVMLSLGVWTMEWASYFLMINAFGVLPDIGVRPVAAAMTMALINFGIMIPAAPGGVGPYEAAGIFALGAFAVNETAAASVALATHAMQYLLITGLGIIFLWREGISLVQAQESDE